MEAIAPIIMTEQDQRIRMVFEKDRKRLFNFIRSRIPNESDAEDLLQDVFFEFTSTLRMMTPIDEVSGWLFRVARNKITDLFRKKKSIAFSDLERTKDDEGESRILPELLSFNGQDAEEVIMQELIMTMLEEALTELPDNQREAFVLHEIEGYSFAQMAEETGESINTHISRKRYAVLYLRERLRELYVEFINN